MIDADKVQTFSPEEQAFRWWNALQPDQNGRKKPTTDPGALARLRRAPDPAHVFLEPAALALARQLGVRSAESARAESVAVLAHVLAHVDDNQGRSLGEALRGPKADIKEALMHPFRLQRLVSARDAEETMRAFREAVLLLKGKAPVRELARHILDWADEERGPKSRTRLLFAFHGAAGQSPEEAPSEQAPAA